jgi:hypothetical protein
VRTQQDFCGNTRFVEPKFSENFREQFSKGVKACFTTHLLRLTKDPRKDFKGRENGEDTLEGTLHPHIRLTESWQTTVNVRPRQSIKTNF